jgi:hypothetical protein
MIPRMYLWELVGRNATEGSTCSGIGRDLGSVMRTVEAELAKFPGCDGRVAEVVQRMSVVDLHTIHVPTGREWLARLVEDGGACWAARHGPADPGVTYDLMTVGEVSLGS